MMKACFPLIALMLICQLTVAQTLIQITNPDAEAVLAGNYSPLSYKAAHVVSHPDSFAQGLLKGVSADTLKKYIIKLASFYNRSTGSDTVSTTTGIGAARRWVYSMFKSYSSACSNRLLPAYVQFNLSICNKVQHRNIMAVLPGMDTVDKSIVIVAGHIDSRSENVCDSASKAEGVEDNASGTALVMELARVLSPFTFKHTIVFLVTIGEEQGLYGAKAFSDYCYNKSIKVKAVLNNDIVGGIICGHTASAPGCSGFNSIDSTHVRLFSSGGYNSLYKGLARYIKLEYKQRVAPFMAVPTGINIMSPEDRTGRSGDHVAFHENGFTAIRVTAANENGDANVTDTAYKDRQHTTRDTLGVDRKHTGTVDSFFVNFNYLARNTIINGNALCMAAISPPSPTFTLAKHGLNLIVKVDSLNPYLRYRVGVRTATNDWDSVYTFTGKRIDTIAVTAAATYFVSVAAVDSLGVESLFSREYYQHVTGINNDNISTPETGLRLMQNHPNPFDEATYISVLVSKPVANKEAFILITDLNGKEIRRLPILLNPGVNEVLYSHGYHAVGAYTYSLIVNGQVVETKQMVFAN